MAKYISLNLFIIGVIISASFGLYAPFAMDEIGWDKVDSPETPKEKIDSLEIPNDKIDNSGNGGEISFFIEDRGDLPEES